MSRRRKTQANGPTQWQASARFREIGRAAARKRNHQAKSLPLCGATKRDGEPCRKLAMKNGRCRLHGGATPSGDNWHVVRWPDPNSPGANEKLHRKLKDRERRAAQREARVAAMTPEERARHERWHRTHQPGSAAARRREKAFRQQSRAVLGLASELSDAPVPSPESIARHERVRQLEEKAAALRADIEARRIACSAVSSGDQGALAESSQIARDAPAAGATPYDPLGVFA